jgi:hypothetical protein
MPLVNCDCFVEPWLSVVYWGCRESGKSTNLSKIYEGLAVQRKGELLHLECEPGHHVGFFDFLVDPSPFGRVPTRCTVYAIDTQVVLRTRSSLWKPDPPLREVPGHTHSPRIKASSIILVIDSSPDRTEDNIDSVRLLRETLAESNCTIDDDGPASMTRVPCLIQFNKRDLNNAISTDQFKKDCNLEHLTSCEAIASEGINVRETLDNMVNALVSPRVQTGDATAGR